MEQEGYGVILTSNNDILYFEYNPGTTFDINNVTSDQVPRTLVKFEEHAPFDIVCYDFDYVTGSLMYID